MGCFLTCTKKDLDQLKQRIISRQTSPEVILRKTVASLAKNAPSLLPTYLKYIGGKASYEMGKLGEQVAARIIEQDLGYKVTQIARAQGVDIKVVGPGKSCLAIEVKTSAQNKSFNSLLGEGHGHKQCSDGWLHAVGVDPSKTEVVGVQINPDRETVSIYTRADSEANEWKPMIRDAPLSQFDV